MDYTTPLKSLSLKSMMNSLSMAGVGGVKLKLEMSKSAKNGQIQLAKNSAEAGIESRVKKTTSINSRTVKTTGSKKKLVL